MPFNFDHVLSTQSPFDANVWQCERCDTADYEANHDLVDCFEVWEDDSMNVEEDC